MSFFNFFCGFEVLSEGGLNDGFEEMCLCFV